jgi:hypothetical protein
VIEVERRFRKYVLPRWGARRVREIERVAREGENEVPGRAWYRLQQL